VRCAPAYDYNASQGVPKDLGRIRSCAHTPDAQHSCHKVAPITPAAQSQPPARKTPSTAETMGLLDAFFKRDPLLQHYKVGRKLGQGTFATVKEATEKSGGAKWAVKIIDKRVLAPEDEQALTKEVEIMRQLAELKHPNIVFLKEVCESEGTFYIVQELCAGGELFDRIVEKEKYNEKDARVAMKQIVSAIDACHDLRIVHRDLKPENLLYAAKRGEHRDTIKLADFGLANMLKKDEALATACGTPGYVAPEVIAAQGYGPEVDIWSLGVIMYILLCGFPPFYSENNPQLFRMIQRCQYTFTRPYWDQVSDAAKDLIRSMLVVDPKKRATCKDIMGDPWMTKDDIPVKAELEGFQKNLTMYNAKRKFKAGVMALAAISAIQSGAAATKAATKLKEGVAKGEGVGVE